MAWERLHGTALMVVVAIDQVLAFESRVRGLTGDSELARARARFDDAMGPRPKALRDLVVHLDDYAVGQGRRQTGKEPQIADPYLETFIFWANGGGTILDLGGEQLNLRAAAKAAVRLAEVVERVRAKYLERAEHEAGYSGGARL